MSDLHQVISIIATAIYDARNDHPKGAMAPRRGETSFEMHRRGTV
jgi:hypothetical protein